MPSRKTNKKTNPHIKNKLQQSRFFIIPHQITKIEEIYEVYEQPDLNNIKTQDWLLLIENRLFTAKTKPAKLIKGFHLISIVGGRPKTRTFDRVGARGNTFFTPSSFETTLHKLNTTFDYQQKTKGENTNLLFKIHENQIKFFDLSSSNADMNGFDLQNSHHTRKSQTFIFTFKNQKKNNH